LTTAVFTLAICLSAVEVVASDVVLSRLSLVGHPVPTTAIAALLLAPLCIHLTSRSTWSGAIRRLSVLDAATVVVAVTAGWSWLTNYDGLRSSQIVSQLQRLGEDNAAHLMMLKSTMASGTALGRSAKSLEINSGFAGYFPGGSLWQSFIGALLPATSTPQLYVASTGLLIALLAGCASSIAATATTRLVGISALAVIASGVVGIRATLGMYEIGFPGQLLVACFMVAALSLLIVEHQMGRGAWLVIVALLVLACATWWSWNLAAPILCLPVAVLVYQYLRLWLPLPQRVFQYALIAAAVVGLLAVFVLRHRVVSTLDTLSTDGFVFRIIPFWMAFALLFGLPIAYRGARRRESMAVSALVLGMAGANIALLVWQLSRVGGATYYTFKLEYLTLALGWGVGALAVAMILSQLEAGWRLPIRIVAAIAAALLVPFLVVWPERSYHAWQVARGVAGPSPLTTCAVDVAQRYTGSIVLATGFGKPLDNYLVTKMMDVGANNNDSKPLWKGIIYDAPSTWPWYTAHRPVVLVQGPEATAEATAAVVDGAATQHIIVRIAPERCK
jgi:hypothetical protein